MLKLDILNADESPLVVSAKLLNEVKFKSRGKRFMGEPGQSIVVDMNNNIGFIAGNHVQLKSGDYQVVGAN